MSGSLLLLAAYVAASNPLSIPANRAWEALPANVEDYRVVLAAAAEAMDGWSARVAGIRVDAVLLRELAQTPASEPLLRAVRERMIRPVDLEDFLLFIDDVLVAGSGGLRGQSVYVGSGRARAHGILLHPDDIFGGNPRVYGERYDEIAIDRPAPQARLAPPPDGALLGPRWTARFKNPRGDAARMQALADANPNGDFAARVQSLIDQLRSQGVRVGVNATLRDRRRGYLMWGAFLLSRKTDEESVDRGIERLERLNGEWQLHVPIVWRHPEGWQATVEAARAMADAYDVVYATQRGAEASNHYSGIAVDISAVGLPRSLTLQGADGTVATFDLSAPHQARDLNLTPEVVEWLESHHGLLKLRGDYPHWDDAVQLAEQEQVAQSRRAGRRDPFANLDRVRFRGPNP